jgi:hypothetical protein
MVNAATVKIDENLSAYLTVEILQAQRCGSSFDEVAEYDALRASAHDQGASGTEAGVSGPAVRGSSTLAVMPPAAFGSRRKE